MNRILKWPDNLGVRLNILKILENITQIRTISYLNFDWIQKKYQLMSISIFEIVADPFILERDPDLALEGS